MRALAAGLAAALAGCFGAGPVPTLPADAEVVFALPPAPGANSGGCTGQVPYLGGVAIGSDTGFALTEPYEGPGCNNNNGGGGGGGMIPFSPTTVFTFPLDGSQPQGSAQTGVAGMSDGLLPPRIATSPAGPIWAFPDANSIGMGQGGSGIDVSGPAGMTDVSLFASVAPAGLVADAQSIYLAGWPTQDGRGDPDGPDFPLDQSAGYFGAASVQATTFTLTTLTAAAGSPATVDVAPWFCEVMPSCLVQNTTTLFAMAHGTGADLAVVNAIDKATQAVTAVDTIPASLAGNVGPVGLAADDARVVWTAAVDPTRGAGCFVFVHPLGGATTMLFSSTSFTCNDAALDDTDVYFAIVSAAGDNNPMQGIGIGRVALADGTFASVRVGVAGQGAGPRRVQLAGDSLYAVDPLAIAKIPKAAITGQDF